MTQIKQQIVEYVERMGGGVSFVELERNVEGFSGEYEFGILEKNLVFWQGVSNEAVDALNALMESGEVELVPTSPLTYHVDGAVPSLPVAKQARAYKEPRWVPIAINLPQVHPARHANQTSRLTGKK